MTGLKGRGISILATWWLLSITAFAQVDIAKQSAILQNGSKTKVYFSLVANLEAVKRELNVARVRSSRNYQLEAENLTKKIENAKPLYLQEVSLRQAAAADLGMIGAAVSDADFELTVRALLAGFSLAKEKEQNSAPEMIILRFHALQSLFHIITAFPERVRNCPDSLKEDLYKGLNQYLEKNEYSSSNNIALTENDTMLLAINSLIALGPDLKKSLRDTQKMLDRRAARAAELQDPARLVLGWDHAINKFAGAEVTAEATQAEIKNLLSKLESDRTTSVRSYAAYLLEDYAAAHGGELLPLTDTEIDETREALLVRLLNEEMVEVMQALARALARFTIIDSENIEPMYQELATTIGDETADTSVQARIASIYGIVAISQLVKDHNAKMHETMTLLTSVLTQTARLSQADPDKNKIIVGVNAAKGLALLGLNGSAKLNGEVLAALQLAAGSENSDLKSAASEALKKLKP